jgi:predicted P-loop ATPase
MKLLAAFGEEVKDAWRDEPKKSYYTDALTFDAITDKDSMLLTSGAIIVVLEELVGKGKKSDDEIKRWITLGTDKGRLPYGRFVTEMPRQFVLAGTTNNYDYLKDPTGNRRYWPITVRNVDKEYININREQLWAEAVYLYKQSHYLALTGEALRLSELEQKKRIEEDVWEDDVVDAAREFLSSPFTTTELLKRMNIALRDRDARTMSRVRSVLRKIGYDNKPTRDGDTVKRMWSKVSD